MEEVRNFLLTTRTALDVAFNAPARKGPEFAASEQEREMFARLQGNQCENCHGPGSRHIELVDSGADDPGAVMRVTKQQARDSQCLECHDNDNSPDFDFDKYWPDVEHYED